MKTIILGLSLLAFQGTTASAATFCSQVGSATICTDTESGTHTTCRPVGSSVICS